MKLIKGIAAAILLSSTLPAHAVYEAVKVTAEVISCPGDRGLTKHHQCQTVIETYDCDEGIITTQTKGKPGVLTYRAGQDSPRLLKVCDAFTIKD